MPLRQFKHVFVRNVKLSFIEVHRAIRAIVLVETEQAVLAMSADIAYETNKSIDELRVSLFFVSRPRGAHINFELETMKRMFPRPHLSIYESSADSESRNMNVMID